MLRSSLLAALLLATGACFYDLSPKTGATTREASSETTAPATTSDATTTTGAQPTTTAASSETGVITTAGETSGETSTATSTTTEPAPGTTLDTTTAADGGLYGPCAPDLPCTDGQQCMTVPDVRGSFCAPACEGSECPAAPPGVTAQPLCTLTDGGDMEPALCALVCEVAGPNGCPAGMSCKSVAEQAYGLCTAP